MIFKVCQYILTFISRWKRHGPSFDDFPSPKDTLCQVWLKLAMWFLRRFLKLVNVFSLIRYYLPLVKGMAICVPIYQGCYVSSLVEIGQVIIKKKTLKVGQFIFAISLLSTLGKGCDPSLNRPESPSP